MFSLRIEGHTAETDDEIEHQDRRAEALAPGGAGRRHLGTVVSLVWFYDLAPVLGF